VKMGNTRKSRRHYPARMSIEEKRVGGRARQVLLQYLL